MRKTRRAFAIIDTDIDDIASINGGIMGIYWYKKIAESDIPKLEREQFTCKLKVRKIYISNFKP
jgi:hypothetical protein